MDRRRFLTLMGLAAAGALAPCLLPTPGLALLNCQDFPDQGMRQCEAGIRSDLLTVSASSVGGQHMDQWCWAASIEMVFRYYGYVVPQERIVRETWGDIVNQPADAPTILKNLNRVWIDEQGKRFRATGDVSSSNIITAAQDLSGDMPLIVGTQMGGGGHAMVLTSLVYWCAGWNGQMWSQCGITSAVVRDPWPGNGRRVLTPEEWANIFFLARIRVQPV